MRFEVLDALSWPGVAEKPNEDSLCHSASLAAVFDGATGLAPPLMPVASDPASISDTVGNF